MMLAYVGEEEMVYELKGTQYSPGLKLLEVEGRQMDRHRVEGLSRSRDRKATGPSNGRRKC